MKPIINLDELEFQGRDHGSFGTRHATVGDKIGAKKLGYNVTVVPPGKKSFPRRA